MMDSPVFMLSLCEDEVPSLSPRGASRAVKQRQLSAKRITMYLTDEVMPLPSYKHKSIKKSKKVHTTHINLHLDNFDAIMKLCER